MNETAKVALFSSAITMCLMVMVLYVARDPLLAYLKEELTLNEQQEMGLLEQSEATIPDMVEKANEAVVSIVASKDVPLYEKYYERLDPFGWFGVVPRVREIGTEPQEVSGGSGFVVSSDGLIVTNRHVVDDKEATYKAIMKDGKSYEVEVAATDDVLDIAVLRLKEFPETDLAVLRFASSSELRLGETVVVIGNALAEFRNSVSVGVISGLSRSVTAGDGRGLTENLSGVIQTDAAINPGNSGGPMLNTKGEVVGMSVATSLGADNISFALPADAIRSVVQSVATYGEIKRPYLGVRYTNVTPRLKELNNLSVDYGAVVARGEDKEELAVLPNSPADKAGLRENDIILEIDDEKLSEVDLATVLRTKEIGSTIKLKLLSQGEEKIVNVTLEAAPKEM